MLYFYKIFISIIIGIIEGITEFFPISSTGHMIIFHDIFHIKYSSMQILEIFIQLGSVCAILVYFLKKWIRDFYGKKKIKKKYIYILISIIPTVLVGCMYYKPIKLLFNITNVMYGLICGSFLFFLAELFKPKINKTLNIHHITLIQSCVIGIFQVLSLSPGFSRSGTTIAIGILLGIKKSVAIEFSFMSAIPLLMGASFFDLIKNIKCINLTDIPIFCIGFIVSFTISLLLAKKLLDVLIRTSFILFGIYRLCIASAIYFSH